MKKSFIIPILIINSYCVAQVGINTSNPQGIFHIDGKKDNPSNASPTTTQQLNDFTVDQNGNVGIGTTEPKIKFEVITGGTSVSPKSGFKLVDGTENDGFALTSNSAGVGTWQPIKIQYRVLSPLGVGSYIHPASTLTPKYTGVSIVIPPGKWILNLVIPIRVTGDTTYSVGSQFPRLRLLDNTDESKYTIDTFSVDAVRPRLVSATISNAQDLGFMNGSLGMFNQTSSNKTYYLVADNFFSNGNGVAYRKSTEFVFDNWNEASITMMRITE